eukprot:jgi/Mesen1/5308/ME000264S04334
MQSLIATQTPVFIAAAAAAGSSLGRRKDSASAVISCSSAGKASSATVGNIKWAALGSRFFGVCKGPRRPSVGLFGTSICSIVWDQGGIEAAHSPVSHKLLAGSFAGSDLLANYRRSSLTFLTRQSRFLSGCQAYPFSANCCLDLESIRSLKDHPDVRAEEMTIRPNIVLDGGQLSVNGAPVLTDVSDKLVVTTNATSWGSTGVFLGAVSTEAKSRHVFPLGVLRNKRFMCCFRFKLWWMTQRMGSSGGEVPLETQFLLVESKDASSQDVTETTSGDGSVYTVFLPLLDGAFRASLQGSSEDFLELCVESGDPDVRSKEALHSVYVHAGSNPYEVVGEAVRAVEDHLKSFVHREKKQLPGMLDYFGWCTWDAFYTDVSVPGVHQGLASLAAGGTPAKFLIIDDGWQSVDIDEESGSSADEAAVTAGTQYASRLTNIKENHKFKKTMKERPAVDPLHGAVPDIGKLAEVVKEAKDDHDLKYVYVWHALMGYWGGVSHTNMDTKHYNSAIAFPVHAPGVLGNQPEMAEDSLTVNGVGVLRPESIFRFYDELHSYLAGAGVDGVKVDVQNILETVAAGLGGRVALTRAYQAALEASIAKNFRDNGIIACMSHNTDGLYMSKQTAVVRASDDFWPRDPASHTIHVASVAYNSMFLGEFMQPDWDMFHSLHPAAEYHAAARAVGGCAVYVSDKPGEHDFDLLKKLVLPDGSVLRARLPGRPTRDCIFTDPARDSATVLKIWNTNLHTGIVGAFNCQGAGWCKVGKKNMVHNASPDAVSGSIRASDVDNIRALAPPDWTGDVALFAHRAGEVTRLPRGASLPLSLQRLEYEVFTVSPIQYFSSGAGFAPLGLAGMFNSGGAVQDLKYTSELEAAPPSADMAVKGGGQFLAFCSAEPSDVLVDGAAAQYQYSAGDATLTLPLPFVPQHLHRLQVTF